VSHDGLPLVGGGEATFSATLVAQESPDAKGDGDVAAAATANGGGGGGGPPPPRTRRRGHRWAIPTATVGASGPIGAGWTVAATSQAGGGEGVATNVTFTAPAGSSAAVRVVGGADDADAAGAVRVKSATATWAWRAARGGGGRRVAANMEVGVDGVRWGVVAAEVGGEWWF